MSRVSTGGPRHESVVKLLVSIAFFPFLWGITHGSTGTSASLKENVDTRLWHIVSSIGLEVGKLGSLVMKTIHLNHLDGVPKQL